MPRSKIRTAAAALTAATALMALTGSAEAYDGSTCQSFFPSGVNGVKTFKIETGDEGVDFGDVLHLFGTPQGTAVACRSFVAPSRIHIRGVLFSDGAVAHAQIGWFGAPTNAEPDGKWLGWTPMVTVESGSKAYAWTSPAGKSTSFAKLLLYRSPGQLGSPSLIRNMRIDP